MSNGKQLGLITRDLLPGIYDKIDWINLWNRKLENGAAFEWAVFAAIVYAAKEKGYTVSFPLIEQYNAGDFFVLRNEIPLTYGSQAGNSATLLSSKKLDERFLYSLVPKALISTTSNTYSIFREGCPYHKIMCGDNYLERTDIIIMPGSPTEGFPRLNAAGNEVDFSYEYNHNTVSGTLRVRNSPLIPCKRRLPRKSIKIPPQGIVEVSVNKTAEVATAQLEKYNELFTSEGKTPLFSLITGNDLSSLPYDTHTIKLNGQDNDSLKENLLTEARGILTNFRL